MHQFIKIISLIIIMSAVVKAQDRFMSITIDDMPYQHQKLFDGAKQLELIEMIIGHLKKYNAEAVGFVNEGKLYSNNKIDSAKLNILKMWLDSGLELGNHTFSHMDINQVSFEEFKDDFLKGEVISRKLAKERGIKYEYFRHPYLRSGETKERMLELNNFLNENNYKVAPVTIDNSEWIFAFAYNKAYEEKDSLMMTKLGKDYISYMLEKIKYYEDQSQKLFERNIKHVLLIHANLLNSNYLGELLSEIKNYGYKFITLDETLTDEAYKSKNTFVGKYGPSWIHRWALTKGVDDSFYSGNPRVPEYIKDFTDIRYE